MKELGWAIVIFATAYVLFAFGVRFGQWSGRLDAHLNALREVSDEWTKLTDGWKRLNDSLERELEREKASGRKPQ